MSRGSSPAAEFAAAGGFSLAILDDELGQFNSIALAAGLAGQGVAALFLSAHSGILDLPLSPHGMETLAKPLTSAQLREAVLRALETAEQPGAKLMTFLRGTG